MSGVTLQIFSSEDALVRGVFDFFSVARTTPFAAAGFGQPVRRGGELRIRTFDSERGHALVDRIKSVFCVPASALIFPIKPPSPAEVIEAFRDGRAMMRGSWGAWRGSTYLHELAAAEMLACVKRGNGVRTSARML